MTQTPGDPQATPNAGDDVVRIGDRVEPGEPQPSGANQAKEEPFPYAGDRAGATVGESDPEVADRDRAQSSQAASQSTQTHNYPRTDNAPGAPSGTGSSHRQPGQLGVSSEPIETDVVAGAARTQPGAPVDSVPGSAGSGDTQGVDVPGGHPMPGTSENSNIVTGVKTTVPAAEVPQAGPGPVAPPFRANAPSGEVAPE